MRALIALVLAIVIAGCTSGQPPRTVKMATTMSASGGQIATCPGDAAVVGGGFEIPPASRAAGKIPTIVVNHPTENGWMVQCLDASGQPSSECKAYVLCAIVIQ